MGMTWGLRLHVTGWDLGTARNPKGPYLLETAKTYWAIMDLGEPMFQPHPQLKISAGPPWVVSRLGPKPHLAPILMYILADMHKLLNTTQPELAQDCWLCLKKKPPYYMAVGAEKPIPLESPPCTKPSRLLTLGYIAGNVSCLIISGYNLSAFPFQTTCSQSLLTVMNSSLSCRAPNGIWLACTSSLTRCINGTTLKTRPKLCLGPCTSPSISVQRTRRTPPLQPAGLHSRFSHRAPILVPLLAGLGVAGCTALGTAALIQGETALVSFSHRIDTDLEEIQSTINMLDAQSDSLAKVVLQNH
ncbi:endogenous retrovirus group S71 member 1 Env polyprotein-like [Cebus imitator]|uniref:endogenous retrovirus group S71 member 1 Env polyprotein-like n=1 Tax=Cebus imitator TaxID=2715852 RepID=UPI00189ABA24|nr:endogenous retrovirus group S71 member 1 Env polyprotein-like [Cebus imitator]